MTIEEEYLMKVSGMLEGFKRSNGGYNFRCHICGDSKKSISKKRGWIHQHKGKWFFGCFNCGTRMTFRKFLKGLDETIYKQYLLDKNLYHKNNTDFNSKKTPLEASNDFNIVDYNRFISDALVMPCVKLNDGQIYLRGRNIKVLDRFFYTDNYGGLLKNLNLNKYEAEFDFREPRLLIPHWNRFNQLAFLQTRSLNLDDKPRLRYKTYRVLENEPRIWGLESVDFNKRIFITEGAFDASLLENGIAMSGADVQLGIINNYIENCYFIMDNEPRNKEITKRYRKLESQGFNVFIWPNNIIEKDINDYWLKYNNLDLFYDESNYFSGLKLKLELAKWIKN